MVVVLLFRVNHNGGLQLQVVLELLQVLVYQVLKRLVPLDMIGKLRVLMPQLPEIKMESMICPVEHGNTEWVFNKMLMAMFKLVHPALVQQVFLIVSTMTYMITKQKME